MKERMQYAIILVQDFCPLQIKITQCPGGFHLKFKATLHTYMMYGVKAQI